MSEGKFVKPWQVTDKIIEWILMQFTFNILWVTLTQKIITWRVSKISWMDMRGFVWVGESLTQIHAIHIQHFTSDSKLKKLITCM